MFCKICGKEIQDDKNICEECELNKEPTEEVETEVVEEPEFVECVEVEAAKLQEEKPEQKKNDKKGFATAAMILGFCSLFVPFFNSITAVLAIVFGALGRKHDLGIIGLVVGIIYFVNQVLVYMLLIFVYVVYFFMIFFVAILANIPV